MPDEPFELARQEVALSQLFLDPANPRLASIDQAVDVNESTYDDCYALEPATQNDLVEQLKHDRSGFGDLVNKIRSQGYLLIDRIVVRPSRCEESAADNAGFVVLEGNRRVAALKTITGAASVNLLSESIRSTFDPIEVLVYEGDDPQVAWKIQGLRHIQGVREWGAYQRAKYLNDMLATQGADVSDLHEATGYRIADVNRYVDSFHAFRQAYELRGDVAEGDFSLFQEAVFAGGVAGRSLQGWLGWSDGAKTFTDQDNLATLLELYKDPDDSGQTRISGALELRNRFAKLLAEPFEALLALFLSGELTLEEADARRKEQAAVASARQDESDLNSWRLALEDAYGHIDGLPVGKIRRAGRSEEFSDLLSGIRDVAQDTVEILFPDAQDLPSGDVETSTG